MSALHTPGPWTVLDHHGVHVLADGGLTVATVAYQLDFARVPGSVQIQNARLIAASPDLLEALEEAVTEESAYGNGCSWIEKARAAIAKATGE